MAHVLGYEDLRPPQVAARFARGLLRVDRVNAERLLPALCTAPFAPVIRGVVRVRDVRPVATDADWAFGRGPEVRGPAEALLMAVAGRRGIAAELSGPGQERLAGRLGG